MTHELGQPARPSSLEELGCTLAFRHVEIVDGQLRDRARAPHALCMCSIGTIYHEVHRCACKFEWSMHTLAEYIGLAAARGVDYLQRDAGLRWSLTTDDEPEHFAQHGSQSHYAIDCPGSPTCLYSREHS